MIHSPQDSVAFAIYLYHKAQARSLSVNIGKLHSLLYLCYGIHYAGCNCAVLNVCDVMSAPRHQGSY